MADVELPEGVELKSIEGTAVVEDDLQGQQVDVQSGVNEFRTLQNDLAVETSKEFTKRDPEKPLQLGEEFDLHGFFEESARKKTDNGGKMKRMGVVFKDLTVVGEGADSKSIPDNLSPLRSFFRLIYPPNWFRQSHGTEFDILHEVSGFCKDGEMLLVLGRPGSGCSTLLRVLSNQRSTYLDVKGSVEYGGIPAEDFGRYAGEAIYAPEEDVHFPTLTVKQTLMFALKTKTPGNLLPSDSKKTFRSRVFTVLMNMFGLAKQVNTLVGNEFVRGLSGGERKRMTITEAMVSQGSIQCWDCSTRGLDAASALDYARSLRITSNSLHKTTIASFYQASQSIFDLFDRVLVLEKGKCIYFGPTKEAKQYFLDLGFDCEPRKSTPDFMTGVTNPQERKIRPGCEETAPKNSAELETAWKESTNYKRALENQEEYVKQIQEEEPAKDFREEVASSKRTGTRKKSIYTTNVFTQAIALTIRQYQLIWGNKFGIFSRYFSVLAQALIYGSVFLNLPLNSTGGYMRGGALFSALLFNAFISVAEMPNAFVGRRITQKHQSYAMYHPAAYHIAQVMSDIPIIFVQVLLFSVITYFMFGLDNDAGKFFIYLIVLMLMALCITNLFRLLANLSPSLYISQQVMSILFITLLTYCGFFIPYQKMRPWLIWVHWIDPFGYAFKALFANEMRGLVFDCTTSGYIPAGNSYTDPANRVCILPGARPGETQVRGEDYLYAAYRFKTSEMAINIIAVLLFWIFFIVVNALAMEYLEFVGGGYTRKVFKRGKAPKQNDLEAEMEQAKIVAQATENLGNTLKMDGGVFMWRDIKYTVPFGGKQLQLLDNVEGWIKPGQMTALMGSSGAGKTTLLDVLAQRKTIGTVEGKMYLNGMPLRKDFERITGYVEQMDVFNPFLTVRESLIFSARLRQEPSVPDQEKLDYVERVLEMMEMKHLGDALIGDLETGTGISVEERKRLTIGMELVAKPHILFLDEPTSGLDSQSAYNIIKFTRKLADAGMPLVCTIHQPSSVLFEYFDRLLLLARGGKTVYFGDIGPHSRTMLEYFEKNGARHCGDDENPAEYILEAIGAGVNGKSKTDWTAAWANSQERVSVHEELENLEATLSKETQSKHQDKAREFATSFWYQCWLLYIRFNIVFWRNPHYNFGRLLKGTAVGLVIGFSFWDLGNSSSDIQYRILAVFQILILGIMLINTALPQFMFLRGLFRRDYASKFYSWGPFSLCLILVELPYLAMTATLCVVCAYWAVGLDSTRINGFYFWITFVLFMWFCVSFGQLLAAASPNLGVALIILPLLNTFLFLFAGVLAPPHALPKFWRSWMYHLDPYRYFLEGIITSVLQHVNIECNKEDLLSFFPPAGQTCGEYTASFFQNGATGYIQNPSATDICNYCQYSSGKEYYQGNDWSEDNQWRNFGILIAYWVFNILAGTFFVWLFRKPQR